MLQWTIGFAINHNLLIYALVILLSCAEGPIMSVAFGVLLRFGFLHLIPIYIALMLGDLLGDAVWYWIGHKYGHNFVNKYGKYFKINEAKVEKMTRLFHKYKHSVLFVSKISNGFGFSLVTLMTAGMVRIPFRMYLAVNLLGQFIWTGILLSVGYFASTAFITINNWFGRVALIAVGVAVVVVLYRYWSYLKSRAENMEV